MNYSTEVFVDLVGETVKRPDDCPITKLYPNSEIPEQPCVVVWLNPGNNTVIGTELYMDGHVYEGEKS